MIRAVWVAVNLIIATIPFSLLIIICSLLGLQTSLYDRVPRWWSRWMLWASAVHVTVQGLEHFSDDRPQIVAANHSSWFDVLALAANIPRRYRFVAKKELGRVPLWGRAWQAAGHIAVDRADTASAVASLDAAAASVRADNSVIVIFPEGTRSATGTLQPFKKGAFMLALQSHFEILPTGIAGAYPIMNRNSWRVRPGRIIVRFGPPIRTVEYDAAHRDELMLRVRTEIEMLLAPATATRE